MPTSTKKSIAVLTIGATTILSLINVWLAVITGILMLITAYAISKEFKETNFSRLSQPAKDWINSLPNAENFRIRFDSLSNKKQISWVKGMIDLRLITQH